MTAVTPTSPDFDVTSSDPTLWPPPLRAIRHITSFVKWRFSLLPPGAYHWAPESEDTPDQKGSEVFIGTSTPLRASIVGQRPAITVERAGLGYAGLGIGDLAFHDLRNGAKAYQDMLPTTLVITVLSRIGVVAERLAFFIQDQIFTLRDELIKTEPCILYTGAKASLSPAQPAGARLDPVASDWMAVVLSMPLFLQHSTSKMPLNRPIVNDVRPKRTP